MIKANLETSFFRTISACISLPSIFANAKQNLAAIGVLVTISLCAYQTQAQRIWTDSLVTFESTTIGICDSSGVDITRLENDERLAYQTAAGDSIVAILSNGPDFRVLYGSPVVGTVRQLDVMLPTQSDVKINGAQVYDGTLYVFGYSSGTPFTHAGFVMSFNLNALVLNWASTLGNSGKICYTGFPVGTSEIAVFATDHQLGQEVVVHYLNISNGTTSRSSIAHGGIDAESCYSTIPSRFGPGYYSSGRFSLTQRGSPGMRHTIVNWSEEFELLNAYAYFQPGTATSRMYASHISSSSTGLLSVSYGSLNGTATRTPQLYLQLTDPSGNPVLAKELTFPTRTVFCHGLIENADIFYLYAGSFEAPYSNYILALDALTLEQLWAVQFSGNGPIHPLANGLVKTAGNQVFLISTLFESFSTDVLHSYPLSPTSPSGTQACRDFSPISIGERTLANRTFDIPLTSTQISSSFLPLGVSTRSSTPLKENLLCTQECDRPCLSYTEYQTALVCQAELPYVLPSGGLAQNAGVFRSDLLSVSGCDSLIFTNILLTNSDTLLVNLDICEGDTTTFLGESFTSAGSYSQNIGTATCTQQVNINVQSSPSYLASELVQLCVLDSFVIGDSTFRVGNQYSALFSTAAGCDSIISYTFEDVTPQPDTTTAQICTGSTYSFEGQVLAASGTYTASLESSLGCDSLRLLTLSVTNSLSGTTEAAFCPADSVEVEGHWFSRDSVWTRTYTAVGGCDSIHRFQVQEGQLPRILLDEVSPSCPADSNGQVRIRVENARTNTIQWSSGQAGSVLNAVAAGSITAYATSPGGCRDSLSVLVDEFPVPRLDPEASAPWCQRSATGTLDIAPTDSLVSIRLGDSTPTNFRLEGLIGDTTYQVQVTDLNGCRYEVAVAIPRGTESDKIVYPDTLTVQLGEQARLRPRKFLASGVQWDDLSRILDCDTCRQPTAFPLEDTWLLARTVAVEGCQDTALVFLRVVPGPEVGIPTAFSPNGDGNNDRWVPRFPQSVASITELLIFDRWGELLFTQRNLQTDDQALGWDGTFKGSPLDPGVFVFLLQYRLLDGTSLTQTGDLTLLR